jgi:hypothetical protein
LSLFPARYRERFCIGSHHRLVNLPSALLEHMIGLLAGEGEVTKLESTADL